MTDLASIIAAHAPIHAGQDCDGGGWVDCRCGKLNDAPTDEWVTHVAEAITEARTITTAEELNALPRGTLVWSRLGALLRRDKYNYWYEYEAHDDGGCPVQDMEMYRHVPAEVLGQI